MLELKIKTSVSSLLANNMKDIEDSLDQDKEYFVVAYLDNALLIGRYQTGRFSFHDSTAFVFDYIQKLRIFNLDEELLFWRVSITNIDSIITNKLFGRKRFDTQGEEVYYKDVEQILLGTNSESTGSDFIRIFEQRGFELIMPLIENTSVTLETRYAVKTRNYLEQWDNGQLSYNDCRFLDFVVKSGEE